MGKTGNSTRATNPSKWRTDGRVANRIRFEDSIRDELLFVGPVHSNEIERIVALRALSSVPELEARYLKDLNPVHVWDAIAQIGFATRVLRLHIDLPTWIQAYLFESANSIMGRSVAWKTKGKVPPPPVREENGVVHRYGDSWKGLSAPNRLETVLEALLFRQGQGRNPVLQAHRFYASVDRARAYARNRAKNQSSEQAIAEMNDPQLNVDNPQLKLKRDRQRIKRT